MQISHVHLNKHFDLQLIFDFVAERFRLIPNLYYDVRCSWPLRESTKKESN